MITYRKAAPDDIIPALSLTWRVFTKFVAPDYEPAGSENFKKNCIENRSYTESLISGENLMFVASDGKKPVGMVAGRGGEILLLFVDGEYQRQGIATRLISDMICALKLRGFDKIVLDSSPCALPFYLKYGFKATGGAVNHYGCIVTPMEYIPNEIWDVLDENRKITGRYIERGRPEWVLGDYHLVVHVWKHRRNGEWLIDKREVRTEDDLGGKWETTGGSAVAGEDSLTAALRETKEELGIDLDPVKGRLFYTYTNGYTGLVDVWVFDCDCSLEDVTLQKGETCDVMWANGDKIREMAANGEFIGYKIYPYLEKLPEGEVMA